MQNARTGGSTDETKRCVGGGVLAYIGVFLAFIAGLPWSKPVSFVAGAATVVVCLCVLLLLSVCLFWLQKKACCYLLQTSHAHYLTHFLPHLQNFAGTRFLLVAFQFVLLIIGVVVVWHTDAANSDSTNFQLVIDDGFYSILVFFFTFLGVVLSINDLVVAASFFAAYTYCRYVHLGCRIVCPSF